MKRRAKIALLAATAGAVLALACETKRPLEQKKVPPASPASSLALEKPAPASVGPPAPVPPPAQCPTPMVRIAGGSFWVGSLTMTYQEEENPRFRTKLRSFCADKRETTAREYDTCVAGGACPNLTESKMSKRCTSGKPGKENHPINCLSYAEADTFCGTRGARLPTEVEWEYLARGGPAMLKYPWGDDEPDGRTCWKNPETCPVEQFPAGAFGLYDVTGNVWEWTSSWFGRYPWPEQEGRHRVYRGGSWSRRFEKWLKPTLRNRASPDHRGSHLGVRCVQDLSSEPCPYGSDSEGRCPFGVDEVNCPNRLVWNGLRCAAPGLLGCEDGAKEVAGYGCVPSGPQSSAGPSSAPSGPTGAAAVPILRERSPSFDSDCEKNQPSRPRAYRYFGGEHVERNRAGHRDGCKNRDVGVGWNSACCPG